MKRGGFDNRQFGGGGGFSGGLGGRPSQAVIGLMIASTVMVVIQALVRFPLILIPSLVLKGAVWTLLTATITYFNPLSWLFGLFMLYFVGRTAEGMLGTRRFLTLYFAGGVLINAILTGFGFLLPRGEVFFTASAFSVMSLLLGFFATRLWRQTVMIYGIPMTGKTMFFVFAGIDIVFMLYGGGDSIGSLLGLGLGFLYVNGLSARLPGVGWAKEKLRLWRIKRKYKNFKVVESEMKEVWDDLEDRLNKRDRNERIH